MSITSSDIEFYVEKQHKAEQKKNSQVFYSTIQCLKRIKHAFHYYLVQIEKTRMQTPLI